MAGISSSLPPPVCPLVDEFSYQDDDLLIQGSKPPKPGADTLNPPPSAIPPSGCSYPQSLAWQLKWDERYLNGWIYAADYHIKERLRIDKDRMATISTPPNIAPSIENGWYVSRPIPGMVKMKAGVPFVFFLDGDYRRPYTVGCCHTTSFMQYWDSWVIKLHVILGTYPMKCIARHVLEWPHQLTNLKFHCQLQVNPSTRTWSLSIQSFVRSCHSAVQYNDFMRQSCCCHKFPWSSLSSGNWVQTWIGRDPNKNNWSVVKSFSLCRHRWLYV